MFRHSRVCVSVLIACLLFFVPTAHAKTTGLTAIEIYPGNDGQNIAQITNFILNGRNEVYLCGDAKRLDKAQYRKLAKVNLTAGMSLERNEQGVLVLSNAPQSGCVVPGNLKLEKSDGFTPAELAEKALVLGTPLPGSDPAVTQLPPLKNGVLLVFVPAPDRDLANYLRAQRQNDIQGWKRYLAADQGGAHIPQARNALSSLYRQQGATELQRWQQSKSQGVLDFAKLKSAKEAADLAHAQVPDDAAVAGLSGGIASEIQAVCNQAQAKLDLYEQALKQRTEGYQNLLEAERLADGAYAVESSAPEAAAAEQRVKAARASFDSALRDTDMQIAAGRPDAAARIATPFEAFATENARLSSDLKQIAALFVARAQKSEAANNWAQAVVDLEKAQGLAASPSLKAEIDTDQAKAVAAANQAAAQSALRRSQDLQDTDVISAYEVLDDLPPAQHALVTNQLSSLEDPYIKAAEARAKMLRQAHEPINGIGDEQGIQQALEMSQRCYAITNDPDLKDQIEVLRSDLATYYLAQGTKYANKPDASGANVAWIFLNEAWDYKSDSNSGEISDERERVRQAWHVKSSLSIGVEFRDSTSRRDSVSFADQLKDALTSGLDDLGQNVIVTSANATLRPNFQLRGDVMEHELNKRSEVIAKQSKYQAGTQQVHNQEYANLNRQYEEARDQVVADRGQLQEARTGQKKKLIEAADKQLTRDSQTEKELLEKLTAVPEWKLVNIEQPYTYREIINHVQPSVRLQFRILDSAGTEVVPQVTVSKDSPAEYTQLDGVQATDTQGVHPKTGMVPQDSDFFLAAENGIRDLLVEKVRAQIASLPQIVLQRAEQHVADGDFDGAAERYILYLKSTPDKDTPERARAKQFLLVHYNFRNLPLGLAAH